MAIAMGGKTGCSAGKPRPKDSEASPAGVDLRSDVKGVAKEISNLIAAAPAPVLAQRMQHELSNKVEGPLAKLKTVDSKSAISFLNALKGAITSMHAELSRDPDPGDTRLRTEALALLEKRIKSLKGENPEMVAKENAATGKAILQNASGDRDAYLSWLATSMAPSSSMRWNASNTVTALFQLNIAHKGWSQASQASAVVSGIAQRLYAASQTPGVQIGGWDLINITNNVVSVYEVLISPQQKNPETEQKFFDGAARLLRAVSEAPPPVDIQKKVISPLTRIETCILTEDGAVAACGYTAAVIDATEKLPGFEKLAVVATQFRALGGISSWHFTQESQNYLNNTLSSLSRRLEASREPADSGQLSGILYGLRGVDGARISEDNQRIVAGIISQVSKRMGPWKEVPPIAAVNAMVHGISTCLEVQSGEIKSAVDRLMVEIFKKVPEPPVTMTDLGYTCAMLVALSGQQQRFGKLIERLWENVDKARFQEMVFSRNSKSDAIACSIIRQAYGVYEKQFPLQLESKLSALSQAAERVTIGSTSQGRIAGFFDGMPGVERLNQTNEHGFDLDIPLRVTTSAGRSYLLNVEVDGKHHDQGGKELFDALRDRQVSKHGWKICRVGLNFTKEEAKSLIRSLENLSN